jgi:choline kinase
MDTLMLQNAAPAGPKAEHPTFGALSLLVLGAVMEVVFVSLPGYIIAKCGMMDPESQKFLANLNVTLFTPCLSTCALRRTSKLILLVFAKLASQLTPDKLPELGIIPVIFLLQAFVSWLSATIVSKAFRFKKRPRFFVTAMAVFGNSNSLPISLVLSLSKTIPSLAWDKIPGDNSEEVAARGILYLMVFQQLGQVLRWSWGFNSLLAKEDHFTVEEGGSAVLQAESGLAVSTDHTPLLSDGPNSPSHSLSTGNDDTWPASGARTPENSQMHPSASKTTLHGFGSAPPQLVYTPYSDSESDPSPSPAGPPAAPGSRRRLSRAASILIRTPLRATRRSSTRLSRAVFGALPPPVQTGLAATFRVAGRVARGLWANMNPPLWAMLAAIVVACTPALRHLFFTRGTAVNISLTRAVEQTGGVAVPLILVVLGANLGNSGAAAAAAAAAAASRPERTATLGLDGAADGGHTAAEARFERKLLVACIVSRMILPILMLAPIFALVAKYAPVSIVDDPVFVVVVFLLAGAPAALQLAQICQLNDVFVGVMTRLLFHSYVVLYVSCRLKKIVLTAIGCCRRRWSSCSRRSRYSSGRKCDEILILGGRLYASARRFGRVINTRHRTKRVHRIHLHPVCSLYAKGSYVHEI